MKPLNDDKKGCPSKIPPKKKKVVPAHRVSKVAKHVMKVSMHHATSSSQHVPPVTSQQDICPTMQHNLPSHGIEQHIPSLQPVVPSQASHQCIDSPSQQGVAFTPSEPVTQSGAFVMIPTPLGISSTRMDSQGQSTLHSDDVPEDVDHHEDDDDVKDEDEEIDQTLMDLDLGHAEDGRPFITAGGRGFFPCRVASSAITSVIKSQFRDPYTSWKVIPAKKVTKMFEMFAKLVAWKSEDEYEVKRNFNMKGSKRLSQMLLEARKKRIRPSWIGEAAWKELVQHWDSADFQKISIKAKKNRSSERGGSVHTGGSISSHEWAMRLSHRFGRPAHIDEVFKETHIRKKDNTWVDKRSEETYGEFMKKLDQQASSTGMQPIKTASRVKLWADVAGGKSRGRLYGFGDMSSRYRLGVESLTQVSQASCRSTSTQVIPLEWAKQISQANERSQRIEAQMKEQQEQNQKTQEEMLSTIRQLTTTVNDLTKRLGSSRRHPDYEDYSDNDDRYIPIH